jgi:hypothetical protein
MRRLPFLRRTLGPEEYIRLVSDTLAEIAPVSELLRRRGIALGRVEQGRAHTVEIEAVSAHLDELRGVLERVSAVRAPNDMNAAHRQLRLLLDAYRTLLREYAEAGRSIDAADAGAYRRHNGLGRAADARACEALQALIVLLEGPQTSGAVPEPLRRIAEKAETYRKLTGGAFAFWE